VEQNRLIDFEDASFSYGQRTVLADVTLALAPGSFQILLGPSGAGKSTLVRLCWLDLVPTAGRIRFFGRPVRQGDRDTVADLRRRIGVIGQDNVFLDHLTLIDNIALPLRASGIASDLRAADLDALLEWVELRERGLALPAALTAGERQRAALARAVILSPEIILADEPTGNVDWDEALRLVDLLVELNRMGKTVLLATHDPNLVEAVGGRVPVQILRLAGARVEVLEAAA
jgi:cell division transport system ATP-binding protein